MNFYIDISSDADDENEADSVMEHTQGPTSDITIRLSDLINNEVRIKTNTTTVKTTKNSVSFESSKALRTKKSYNLRRKNANVDYNYLNDPVKYINLNNKILKSFEQVRRRKKDIREYYTKLTIYANNSMI